MQSKDMAICAELNQRSRDHRGVQLRHGCIDSVRDLARLGKGQTSEDTKSTRSCAVSRAPVPNGSCSQDQERLENVRQKQPDPSPLPRQVTDVAEEYCASNEDTH